jgi:hypothetical protein
MVVNVQNNLYKIDRISSSCKKKNKGKVFNSYIEAESYVKNNGYFYSYGCKKESRRPFTKNKNINNIW